MLEVLILPNTEPLLYLMPPSLMECKTNLLSVPFHLHQDEDEDEDVAMDTAMSPLEQVQYSANMQDIETVINCLEELCTIVRDAVHIIVSLHVIHTSYYQHVSD